MVRSCLIALVFVLTSLAPAPAQEQSPWVSQSSSELKEDIPPLRVGIIGLEPFLISKDGIWSGLTIDVWEKVATRNGWSFTYVPLAGVDEAIAAVKKGEVDIVAGNVSILAEFSGLVDFSQPYFRSGLQIMISDARPHTLKHLLEDLSEWGHLRILWWVIGGIVVFTILVMFFERHHNPDFPKAWPDSIAEAFYYVITLSLGKSAYKGFTGWFGRLVLVFWTILAVFVVAYITSSITSSMTLEKLRYHINGPQDLPGKVVGTVQESAALPYLKRHAIEYKQYRDLPEAVSALLKGEIPAIVGAAPILQYYDHSNKNLPITEVGPIFAPYNYGFAFRPGYHLRLPLNQALLTLQESGDLADICREYFGNAYQP